MAKLDLPAGFVVKPSASGPRYYWEPSAARRRAGWKSLPLGQDLVAAIQAAKKRNDEVDAAALGRARPAAVKRMQAPVTVAELIRRYKDAGWPSVKRPGHPVSAATQKEYGSKFRTLEKWAGPAPLRTITAERVAKLRDALMTPVAGEDGTPIVRHTMAHATLRVGRSLFTWAEMERLITKGSNPFENFGLGMPLPRHQVWSAPARELLLDLVEHEPSMQLAVDLAFQFGQREADLLRMIRTQYVAIPPYKIEDRETYAVLAGTPVPAMRGRASYVPGDVKGIRLRQNKGKRWVEVPVVGATRARLEAELDRGKAAGIGTILFDDRAMRPWAGEAGQTRFIRRFAELRAAAIARAAELGDAALAEEMRDLQYRDFRRTAVVHMGELGVVEGNIASVTGHDLKTVNEILEVYMPRTTGQAARAIAQRTERGGEAEGKQEKAG